MAMATTSFQFRRHLLRKLTQFHQIQANTKLISISGIHHQYQPCAHLSTSKKDRDSIAGEIPRTPVTNPPPGTTGANYKSDPTTVTGTKSYWQSYGFDFKDPEEDLNNKNYVMFWTMTIGIVVFSFMLAYWPENKLRDWSGREAYIELARREALGLPAIDPNLVPPENINLPTDEELGDYEIVI